MLYGAKDDCVYPGTSVLINKIGLTDERALMAFETEATLQRMREGFPVIDCTTTGYCALHRHLFQDVYDWAGDYRRTNLTKGNSVFCRHEYIEREMERVFASLREEKALRGLASDVFSERAAAHISELNAIHPFREGNGRIVRAFLDILANGAGYRFDMATLLPDEWLEASIQAFMHEDIQPMTAVIRKAIEPTSR